MMDVTFTQQNLEYFLLIVVRMTSFIYIAPFFGHSNTPQRIKLGLALVVSYLIYSIMPTHTVEYSTIWDYAAMVLKEGVAGLLIGFSAYICNTIILFSGRLIDTDIGLAMATSFDPLTKSQVSISGTFYSTLLAMLMITSNMHLWLLGAMVDSFKLIPLGGMKIGATMYTTVLGFVSDYFIIGFRIVLPVFAAMLLLNCVLGILTKIAPQMHMFSIGIQLKVLLGLIVLFFTVTLLPSMASFIFEKMKDMVIGMMRGMF